MQNKTLMFDSSIFLQFLLSLPQKYLSAVLYLYTCIAIALGETLAWFLTSHPAYYHSLSQAIIHTNSNLSQPDWIISL